jgi:DNA primase
MALESCGPAQAKSILRQYRGRPLARHKALIIRKPYIDPPEGLMSLSKAAGLYLRGRNFKPLELARKWGLQSFRANGGNFSGRLYIPVIQNGVLVSWQARDVSGKSNYKYLALADGESAAPIKDTVYGIDNAKGPECIVVEGVFDAMRLGYGAVALFGIKYTQAQIKILRNKFKAINILFDPEPQAQASARKLAAALNVLGARAVVWELPGGGDPGDLSPEEAEEVRRAILKAH